MGPMRVDISSKAPAIKELIFQSDTGARLIIDTQNGILKINDPGGARTFTTKEIRSLEFRDHITVYLLTEDGEESA